MSGSIEIVVRSFIYLIALFLVTKWLGKKQLSQLSIFEFISSIVLGGIVAFHTSATNSPIKHGLIAMLIWFLIPLTIKYISLKNKTVRDFFTGKSTIFIKDGKVLEDNLKKERYSTDDLLEVLRKKNMFNVADVEFAVLEPSGVLNVLPKKDKQPITPSLLGITLPKESPPETVIMDGKILLEPLANIGLNPTWLEEELAKQNATIHNVFIGQVDSDGQLTIDIYDDQLTVPTPIEKPLLLATMKKCQADIKLFALATNNKKSKTMYEENSKKLLAAIEKITPLLIG